MALYRGPQHTRLCVLVAWREGSYLEEHPQERFQPFGARVRDTDLPLLHRAAVDADARSQLALRQATAPTVTH